MSKNKTTISYAGRRLHPAVIFLNSNKSEWNIKRLVKEIRAKCIVEDIWIGYEIVVTKGPDRDIDREAVNTLIGILMCGQYEVVVVDKITELTGNVHDLEAFLHNAAQSGIRFFELSTMRYFEHDTKEGGTNNHSDS